MLLYLNGSVPRVTFCGFCNPVLFDFLCQKQNEAVLKEQLLVDII